MNKSICITLPDDFHAHLRQGELLTQLVPIFSKYFGKVLIMPNTSPPITNSSLLHDYHQQIKKLLPSFIPLMTFVVIPHMSLFELKNLKKAGAIAGKLYPANTTFLKNGTSDIEDLYSSLEILEELDIVLCIHGELPLESPMEAEILFLKKWLTKIIKKFPKLRIVLEHISCKESVQFIKEYNNFEKLVGTITPHHLHVTIENLLGSHFNPFLFCKPIVKKIEDREALQEAAFSSLKGFFLGTDSAPHPTNNKLSSSCPPGIFSAPVAIPLITQIFSKISKLDFIKNLENFCSINGSIFYKLPINKKKIKLEKNKIVVESELQNIKTFLEGETLFWQISLKDPLK